MVRAGVENYSYDERRGEINVLFEYSGRGGRGKSAVRQKARVTNAPMNTQWALNPQVPTPYPRPHLGLI